MNITVLMAELRPYPFEALVRRMFRELEQRDSIFDLPRRRFFVGEPGKDLSVTFHGLRAATPFGPAAGPHTQLAQNIVLSWLVGGRIIELKTVQVLDDLNIPRPCIDMQTVGYNVEWSQELSLDQSLEEYVRAAMMIRMLVASGRIPLTDGADQTVFDMSVGYDLAGIRDARVQRFIAGLRDARDVVERLRSQIPDELPELSKLDFDSEISRTLTLSTFHGCPPTEIEQIVDFLLRDLGLNVMIKLNPTLLGPEDTRRLLHDTLGYTQIRVPDSAFERDTTWDQAVGMVERLKSTAAALGLGLGVKLTNTLVVENHRDYFAHSEKEMYLSGRPLHVLAMELVRRFRAKFGECVPISFSAGIDRHNFADAVALGLTPITVCSDLLKPGGYGRAQAYLQELVARMDQVGADDITSYVRGAYRGTRQAGQQEFTAAALNAEHYVPRLVANPRYCTAANAKPPRKIGRRLRLFDCLTCDKCIPVCPNNANFAFVIPPQTIARSVAHREDGRWRIEHGKPLHIEQPHQIGNFADLCNDCGNCDVFCPEDGGPHILKPRFFACRETWEAAAPSDGLYVERVGDVQWVRARLDGQSVTLRFEGSRVEYRGEHFALRFDASDVEGTLQGQATVPVDLGTYRLLDALRQAVTGQESTVNYVDALMR